MQRYQGYSRILATGAPAPEAVITVNPVGTPMVLSDLFSDNLVPPTAQANPFTASVDGYFDFYAANGRYDVTFASGGIPTPYTWSDILLMDGGLTPNAVVQAQLGGSRFVLPDVVGSPATVDAVNFLWVLIPSIAKAPAGLVVTLVVACQVGTGSSVVVQLVDDAANVIVVDPDPFTDDTQFVEHSIVVTLQALPKLVKLQAVVTAGDALPLFFIGDIRYSLN